MMDIYIMMDNDGWGWNWNMIINNEMYLVDSEHIIAILTTDNDGW